MTQLQLDFGPRHHWACCRGQRFKVYTGGTTARPSDDREAMAAQWDIDTRAQLAAMHERLASMRDAK